MYKNKWTKEIKEYALKTGFDIVGISPPDPVLRIDFYRQWLSDGFAGDMSYLKRGIEKRGFPEKILSGVLSVISLGISYYQRDESKLFRDGKIGRYISRYAWGIDYHNVLTEKMKGIVEFIKSKHGNIKAMIFVDTGPILEREIAQRAGLGWIGKNTTLISPSLGSWFFLGEIFLNVELEYDSSMSDRCGRCNKCVDSCPTGALVAPYKLNSVDCLSYLTIENKKGIPHNLREAMGTRLFGCDRCQDVCPWNSKPDISKERQFQPVKSIREMDIYSLFYLLTEKDFSLNFNMSPIMRTKRSGLLRNAAVVLGNIADTESVSPIIKGLRDSDPIVRGHSAWAAGRIRDKKVKKVLSMALSG
ncbi:MAG: tRNA epoxyqueuosine(34) reductase QueG [Nitrospirota bacterium]